MSPNPNNITVRRASTQDYSKLSNLISFEYYLHRHLDWQNTLSWLGKQPFWLAEKNEIIQAAFACPADPPDIHWIRLFVSNATFPPEKAWEILLNAALNDLAQEKTAMLASLAFQDWYKNLLEQSGFRTLQSIVVLYWNGVFPSVQKMPTHFFIRPMLPEDLDQVVQLDHDSFEPQWRNSLEALIASYEQSDLALVLEHDEEISGYLISTATYFTAHLARIAVKPNFQRMNLGSNLVAYFLQHCQKKKYDQVSVNTQNNNFSSLHLYSKMNFTLSDESYPVFILPKD
ncbi:MAG: GNAT family N-acetyltransferase [Anaerolineaceae bacterium]